MSEGATEGVGVSTGGREGLRTGGRTEREEMR